MTQYVAVTYNTPGLLEKVRLHKALCMVAMEEIVEVMESFYVGGLAKDFIREWYELTAVLEMITDVWNLEPLTNIESDQDSTSEELICCFFRLSQAVSKLGRFGPTDTNPYSGRTGWEQVRHCYYRLKLCLNTVDPKILADAENYLDSDTPDTIKQKKKAKVLKFLDYPFHTTYGAHRII